MMSLESIKQRLNREQNLSFLEFNYSLLQAYDFLELKRKKIVRFNLVAQTNGEILFLV